MAQAAFDTLSMARSLEQDYDMPPKQAEGVATLVYKQLSGNVATKEDIARLDDNIADLKEHMATKEDIEGVHKDIARLDANMATKADLANSKVDILKWMIGLMFIQSGLIVGLVKVFG